MIPSEKMITVGIAAMMKKSIVGKEREKRDGFLLGDGR